MSLLFETPEAASRAQEAPREREDTLPSSGHRLTPMYGSGYHTPELTASQNASEGMREGVLVRTSKPLHVLSA